MKLFCVSKTKDGTLWLQKRREFGDKFQGTRIVRAVSLSRTDDERVFRFAIDMVNLLVNDAK